MYIIYSIICIYTLFTVMMDVSMFSDDGMEINIKPLLSRKSTDKEYRYKTTTIPIPHSVTSIQNSSIPTTKGHNKESGTFFKVSSILFTRYS